MRKYHRWLSILVGLFILWIAATGSIVQFSRMTAPAPPRPAIAGAADGPSARAEDGDEATPALVGKAKPPEDATRQFIHFVTELHSGEEFGITGQIVSLISGLALIFFAISGLWMYIQMYRRRAHRHSHPKRLFW